MANRLVAETSPYLLQHKDNPVAWYAWGDEAFARARAEDKPVFLSIGYAACHWCHVMEHESFEDEGTAAFLNEHFVAVKVDREERPDIDAIYMEAVQLMTGQGGWPMSMFLTPEGVPFYGGTYFPPEERYGMPSFRRLLEAIAGAWRERRDEVTAQGQDLLTHLGATSRFEAAGDLPGAEVLTGAVTALESSFDAEWGGFGSAPKFPQPMTIDLLMRMAGRGEENARRMVERTLDAMASGGMYDQLGGGFARYSVDRHWLVPHFEKMLYDNAQLLRTYARGWQLTGNPRYREVVEATAAWMLDEMRDPGGGFYSSVDADSEGEEGKFYVWTLEEVRAAAGADADVAIARWGFTAEGNFEGKNIPIRASESEDAAAVERARAALLQARAARVRPATDTKVLTAWNALTASALAEAGEILGNRAWIEAAGDALGFVLGELRVEGRLMRSYGRRLDGTATVQHLGYCEDYAFVLEACLSLFEATSEPRWLREGRWAGDEVIRLFLDPVAGSFFTTGKDAAQLITRSKDVIDNAMPAANSVLALELQRLSLVTGEATYQEHAEGILRAMTEPLSRSPAAFGHLLGAVDFLTGVPLEIVVVGDPGASDTRALLAAIHEHFIPNKVILVAASTDGLDVPLLQGKEAIDGRATAYVCRRGTCKMPVNRTEDLVAELEAAA